MLILSLILFSNSVMDVEKEYIIIVGWGKVVPSDPFPCRQHAGSQVIYPCKIHTFAPSGSKLCTFGNSVTCIGDEGSPIYRATPQRELIGLVNDEYCRHPKRQTAFTCRKKKE